MGDRTAWSEAAIVSAIGAVLGGLHLLHGIEEIPGELPAVLYGVLLPFLVSLLIVWGGYWTGRRDWSGVSPSRVVVWCCGGVAIGVGLSALLVLYQAAEGTTVSDRFFVLAMFGTYGGAAGLLLGRYDVHRRAQHVQQKRKTRRLDEFASVVSHDLRSPLNVAAGRLELAREECDSEHLDDIERAHDRMERLIENLLALARKGDGAVDREEVALDRIVKRCWQGVATTEATLVTDTTRAVRADPEQLHQLLENLIRNAIEHGGDDVTVTVGDLDDGFYVADDGPGIPADEREQVFDWGFSTSQAGTGLGLAIVRDIAETHGWTVTVTEGSDGGARFEITGVGSEN